MFIIIHLNWYQLITIIGHRHSTVFPPLGFCCVKGTLFIRYYYNIELIRGGQITHKVQSRYPQPGQLVGILRSELTSLATKKAAYCQLQS